MRTVAELIGEAADARGRVLAAVAALDAEQSEWQPAAEAWSVQAIVEHLVLAEQAGVQFIWRAADGVRRGRPVWQGEPAHRGLPIEEVIARTWRFQEEAPPNATPARAVPLSYWTATLAAAQPVLAALGEALHGLDVEAVVFPHFISGPLDAFQRLEFVRWHMDHHRAQILAVRDALDSRPS